MTKRVGQNISLFLAGALVAGAVVTLTTPYSGMHVMRLARRQIKDCARRVSEEANGLRQKRDQLVSEGKQMMRVAGKVFA